MPMREVRVIDGHAVTDEPPPKPAPLACARCGLPTGVRVYTTGVANRVLDPECYWRGEAERWRGLATAPREGTRGG